MRVLAAVVVLQQVLQGHSVCALGVQLVVGCGYEFAHPLRQRVLDVFEQCPVVDQPALLGVQVLDGADLLEGEEDADFVREGVECVLGEAAGELGVEVLGVLVDVQEVLGALAEELELDFVEDLVGLVLPVHAVRVSYNFILYLVIN